MGSRPQIQGFGLRTRIWASGFARTSGMLTPGHGTAMPLCLAFSCLKDPVDEGHLALLIT